MIRRVKRAAKRRGCKYTPEQLAERAWLERAEYTYTLLFAYYPNARDLFRQHGALQHR